MSADGVINTVFTMSDPRGMPLDREGITTPGAIALSFVAARIPQGQQQYVAYTTRNATGAVEWEDHTGCGGSGGTYTKLPDGQYRYVFDQERLPRGLTVPLRTRSVSTDPAISRSSIWGPIISVPHSTLYPPADRSRSCAT